MTIQEEFAKKIEAENRREKVIKWAPVLVLVGLIVVFTIARGTAFASWSNLVAILNQWAIPLIVGLGLTFVIMLGSIDLSIDGTVGMAGSLFACFVMNTQFANDFGVCVALISVAFSCVFFFVF